VGAVVFPIDDGVDDGGSIVVVVDVVSLKVGTDDVVIASDDTIVGWLSGLDATEEGILVGGSGLEVVVVFDIFARDRIIVASLFIVVINVSFGLWFEVNFDTLDFISDLSFFVAWYACYLKRMY
jgi:hypothetical protein